LTYPSQFGNLNPARIKWDILKGFSSWKFPWFGRMSLVEIPPSGKDFPVGHTQRISFMEIPKSIMDFPVGHTQRMSLMEIPNSVTDFPAGHTPRISFMVIFTILPGCPGGNSSKCYAFPMGHTQRISFKFYKFTRMFLHEHNYVHLSLVDFFLCLGHSLLYLCDMSQSPCDSSQSLWLVSISWQLISIYWWLISISQCSISVSWWSVSICQWPISISWHLVIMHYVCAFCLFKLYIYLLFLPKFLHHYILSSLTLTSTICCWRKR